MLYIELIFSVLYPNPFALFFYRSGRFCCVSYISLLNIYLFSQFNPREFFFRFSTLIQMSCPLRRFFLLLSLILSLPFSLSLSQSPSTSLSLPHFIFISLCLCPTTFSVDLSFLAFDFPNFGSGHLHLLLHTFLLYTHNYLFCSC